MAKIVFMGTPEFACPSLLRLVDAGHQISLVLCQPDKKKGRGHQLQAPPVKELALQLHIELFQPLSLKEPATVQRLSAEEADFFVVVAYGRILPPSVLALPKQGCINVHASLLPQLRGAAPIQYSLLLGHPQTGVCTMKMEAGLDTGDLLLCQKTPISEDETVLPLTKRLSSLGAELLEKTLERYVHLTPKPQNHDQSSYAKMITKADRAINWQEPARELYNRFRALSPQPGVNFRWRSKGVKIMACHPQNSQGNPGEVLQVSQEGVLVGTGAGALLLSELQPQSKKPMAAKDFANGYQLKPGDYFED